MGPALRSHRRVGGVHPEPLCDAHTICGGYCDELSDVGPSTFPIFRSAFKFSFRDSSSCLEVVLARQLHHSMLTRLRTSPLAVLRVDGQ